MAALGVLLALALSQRTARIAGVNPGQVWNLCIVALFAALVASRLLLVLVNWSELRLHPAWMLGLAMIHHPLLAGAGGLAGVDGRRAVCALAAICRLERQPMCWPRRWPWGWPSSNWARCWPGRATGLKLGPQCAGLSPTPSSGRALERHAAGRSAASGAGVCGAGFLTIAIGLLVWLPMRRQQRRCGRAGSACRPAWRIYLTEMWRDTEGRGALLGGALDGPQMAAIVLVLAGALMLLERKGTNKFKGFPPFRRKKRKGWGTGLLKIGEQKTRPRMTESAQRPCARLIEVPAEAQGQRLDQFLGRATGGGEPLARATCCMDAGRCAGRRRCGRRHRMKLRGGERIVISRRTASGAAEGHAGRHSAGRGI